jgi:ABC-2 type transport system ATP-binding protein
VYGDLTVVENLRYFARLLGVDRAQVAAAIGSVHLDGFEDRRVDDLSGGQRARVSLAVALLNGPPLLVLDEPTVGLDPVLRRDLWAQFAELAEAGRSLIVTSHVMDEANRCDWLVLVRDGAILATGTPAELLARTATTTVEDAFLALIEAAA